MGTLRFKTYKAGGVKRSEKMYACRVQHTGIVTIDKIVEDMAGKMHVSTANARYCVSNIMEYILKSIEEGYTLHLGAFVLYLSLRGMVEGADGAYPKDAEGPTLNVRASQPLKDVLAKLTPVNVTLDDVEKPRIRRVTDEDLKENLVISGRSKVLVSGAALLTPGDSEDEYIAIENADGEVLANGLIEKSTATTLDARFPTPLPEGPAVLVIYTRSGDANRPEPVKARKKITVRHA